MRKGFCAEKFLCVKAALGEVSACIKKVSVCKNFFVQSVWASFSVSKFSCVKVFLCKLFCAKVFLCKRFCV